MKKTAVLWVMAVLGYACAHAQQSEQDQLRRSGEVLIEIMNVPNGLPRQIVDRAECVIVVPSVKRSTVGHGAMSCRGGPNFTGPWGPPAMYVLEGLRLDPQLMFRWDFVLLVVNPKGVDALLKSNVRLGREVSAAAGPKGREAEIATDATMRAQILIYSRYAGLIAGDSLEGATLRSDDRANNNLYGRAVTARQIVIEHKVSTPPSGQLLISALQKHSPANKSDAKSLETAK